MYKSSYAYLLTKDIQNILNYSDYNIYNSYNANQKVKNSYAVLDVFDKADSEISNNSYEDPVLFGTQSLNVPYDMLQPIGEKIIHPKFTNKSISQFFRDFNILPGSESMASETGKFVINNTEDVYQCSGFKLNNLQKSIQTIFAIKPNIPARFKSHVASDAYLVEEYDLPIFTEDLLPEYTHKTDGTIINAVCVFMPIKNDGRFLCGEIECSEIFSRRQVIKREIIKSQLSLNVILNKEGQFLKGHNGKYTIGVDENGEEVALYGFDSVKIISCENIGLGGNFKIIAECVKRIGSSRIISSTGIKGVTKPKFDLGFVTGKNAVGHEISIPVDLIIGSNSIKAKENTLYLAQAALAHQLGFTDKEYISSIDIKEVNNLKDKLTPFIFTDDKGITHKAFTGIVPIKITEMAYMYKNAKSQSFMEQSAWYLNQNGYSELSELIYSNSVSEEDKELVAEFTKIIYDDCGKYIEEDQLPVYDLYQLKEHFSLSDCKLETNPMIPHISKLLDFDNKGFYIFLPHKNEYIRMPSAALINRFVSKIADGTYIYPRLLTVVSQIIETTLKKDELSGNINLGYIMRKSENRFSKSIAYVNKYIDLCVGMLHYKNNLISNLMKPKIFGCSMKQMVDINVPLGVVVIIDHKLYERLAEKTGGYIDRHNEFYALCVRNPVLWKSQVQSLKVWDYDTFKTHLGIFTKENTDTYFNEKYCKDLILLNPEDAILQQSDVDGDLMPLFVPEGNRAQELLAKFKQIYDTEFTGVNGITKDELNWIGAYRSAEVGSNSIFEFSDKEYKINSINLKSKSLSDKSFSKYFANSIIAKGDIGIATFNLWTLQCLLDIYGKLTKEGKITNAKGQKVGFVDEDYNLISYAYSRLVQDLVVRGIKWNESGSSEFKPFYLQNIIKREFRNSTYSYFNKVIGLGEIPTNKLFEILNWGDGNGYIAQIMAFISFYNSGNINIYNEKVTPEFEKLMISIFYGSRLKGFFDIKNTVDKARSEGYKYKLARGPMQTTMSLKMNNPGTAISGGTLRLKTKNQNPA
jgi:hypothetical protein